MGPEIFVSGTKQEMLDFIATLYPAEVLEKVLVHFSQMSQDEIAKVFSIVPQLPEHIRHVDVVCKTCGLTMAFTSSCGDRKNYGILGKLSCACGHKETIFEERP